ncbi:MAG: phosphatidylserine/phosphatidylglycerophosphate/cardiolipin synthase family protein [Planctomycetota bacterium]
MDLLFEIASWTLSILSAGHALVRKRDPRAGLGWLAFCLILRPWGALVYWLFGVNFLRTRARRLGRRWPFGLAGGAAGGERSALASASLSLSPEAARLAAVSGRVTRRPLVGGNRVVPLVNGEEAYPAMLAAIHGASRSVSLATYIFDTDETGRAFVAALSSAAARGVDVKVLVDGFGEHYSRPRVSGLLQPRGVRVVRFLPASLRRPGLHMNLRNHRKILVVDGRMGFTGGMNLGDRHLAARTANPRRVIDLHFQVEGPVVTQMEEVFLEDWSFATGESCALEAPAASPRPGDLVCRGISGGPNEDFEKLRWIIQGSLSAAARKIRIMTPYFVPDRGLVTSINNAALRGVGVEVLLPVRNNLPPVAWASRAMLWELLQNGVRIFFQPPPFVHTKLVLVDEGFALIGSTNLDSRSLRLNFEFDLEVHGEEFAANLARHFETARNRSRETSLEEMDARPLPVRVRDAAARLLAPYL